MTASAEHLLWMYEKMLEIREFEETMAKVYLEGKLPPHIQKGLAFDIGGGPVPGEMHLAAGQEPVAVGVCAHLRREDTVVGTHRPHHFAIAKGVPLQSMAAEMFGKEAGLCRGKGGHMHLFDTEHKFSCSGIVGASLPPACGAALAAKKRGQDWVAVAFFGEGAANQGAFHEALNLAALWKLPVLFVCENNGWSEFSPTRDQFAAPLAKLAGAFGIPHTAVDGNDVLAVADAAARLVAEQRAGGGARVLECATHRVRGHFEGDPQKYRPAEELAADAARDPIERAAAALRAAGCDDAQIAQVSADVDARVAEALAAARADVQPAFEDAIRDVYTVASDRG